MRFTNKLNLPSYIVDWLLKDDYDHNDDPYTISATTLMKPTRAYLLTTRHLKKLETDVVDRLAAKLGSAVHDSFEKVETAGVRKEDRVKRTIEIGAVTYTITGKFDVLEDQSDGTKTLRDIKNTSVWALILGGKDDEYRKQMSIYRWLLYPSLGDKLNTHGFIDFFFTDWSSTKAKQDRDYPQLRLHHSYKVNLMSLEDTEAYIVSRLEAIEKDKNKADDELTPCTKKELWAGDEKFAVYKNKKAKKATRVLDSMEQAEDYLRNKAVDGSFIQRRPPQIKRCKKYCSAYPVCNQAAAYEKKGLLG